MSTAYRNLFTKVFIFSLLFLMFSYFAYADEAELKDIGIKFIGDLEVFSKKIKRISMEIYNDLGKFIVYIDNDRLDAYRTKREAEKAGMTFIKQYKGMK